MKGNVAVVLLLVWSAVAFAQSPRTYCNPINVDYGYTPIPNFSEWGRHRATADPVIVNYQGDYYLFSTHQCIEAINENGVSQRTPVVKAE